MPFRFMSLGLLRTPFPGWSGRRARSFQNANSGPRSAGAQQGRVSLVGAGCGDPELLTLKAARLLASADVVIYDRLVAPAILELAEHAERVYVGKTVGRHTLGQRDIEAMMLQYARSGANVVRLKGGDPFLFGRGGEEMLSLRKQGIEVDVCPGISAALGCAASAGIPLTRRGVAEGCLFITGRDRWGDIPLATESGGLTRLTVVIYMGMGRLRDIVTVLRQRGLPGDWPIAVIENGTTDSERGLFSSLDVVVEAAAREQLAAPALLIVGQTVKDASASVMQHEGACGEALLEQDEPYSGLF